jgi:alpha-aminoadipic semialdehyde synthase
VLLNVQERPDILDDLIKNHDVVVSLLPWQLHPDVSSITFKFHR